MNKKANSFSHNVDLSCIITFLQHQDEAAKANGLRTILNYTWLHNCVTDDCMFCYTCALAVEKGLMQMPKEQAFVNTGFRKWK